MKKGCILQNFQVICQRTKYKQQHFFLVLFDKYYIHSITWRSTSHFFMTKVTIWISILQTFLTWRTIFFLRQAIVFLLCSSYDMLGLACSSNLYECFTLNAMSLSNNLLPQRYDIKRFKLRLGRFMVPFSRMLNDNLVHDHIHWHPPSILDYVNNWRTCYWPWPCYRIWPFYRSSRAFNRRYETGVTYRQMKIKLLRIPGTEQFMMCICSMLKSVFPKLVMFPDFEFRISLYTSILLAIVFLSEEVHVYQRRVSLHA